MKNTTKHTCANLNPNPRRTKAPWVKIENKGSGLLINGQKPTAHDWQNIMAAPELLEACQCLLWKARDYHNGLKEYPETETPEYVKQLGQYLEQAQAAINKAKGV